MGLVRVDPATNAAKVIDRDLGASISATGDALWRVGYYAGKAMRYELPTGRRTLTLEEPGPLSVFARPDGVWVSLHADGKVRRLDPTTGRSTATTVVTTPDCCGAAEFAQVGSRVYVTVTKDGTLVGLDPASAKVVDRVQLQQTCDGLRPIGGYLWTCWFDSEAEREAVDVPKIQRIDPASFASLPITVGLHDGLPGEVDGEAWIPVGDRIVHLDHVTGQPDRELHLDMPGYNASNLLQAFDAVWVTSRTDPRVVRIEQAAFRDGS
jgi:streptogramin lyase